MGIKFRKSIKVAPGVKFNVGKKSIGLSVGGKYGGLSFNTKSGLSGRTSAYGTGLSYRWHLKNTKSKNHINRSGQSSETEQQIALSITTYLILTICFGILGIHRFYRRQYLIGLIYLLTVGIAGIGWIIDIVNAVKMYKKMKSSADSENNEI